MPATVVAVEHELTPRNAATWWLEVAWRFRNPAERRLHVLSHGPLSMLSARPFVIDHTATDQPLGLEPHIDPTMEFVVVEAHSIFDLRRTYPLPDLDLQTPRQVVAKFSVSYDVPDSRWIETHAWDAIRKWQQVIQSSPFEIGLRTQLRRGPDL